MVCITSISDDTTSGINNRGCETIVGSSTSTMDSFLPNVSQADVLVATVKHVLVSI